MNSSVLVEPSHLKAPPFTETAGPEVAELCDMADFTPDPEQRLILDHLFAMDDGKAAAFESAIIAPRQNLKTGALKQAALGWLFITRERLIVWSAHEFRTAQEAFRDLDELIAGFSWMAREVKQVFTGKGQEAIELKDGRRLMFKARTKSGGRGLTGDKVILDEAFALQPDHMGALLPTLSAVPDPQVVYGSSAGMSSSEILRRIRDRGRTGSSPRMFYVEWCSDVGGCVEEPCSHELGVDGCALDDPANQARANPLLGRTRSNGTGLTAERLAALRQALPPQEFAREHMGWWDEPDSTEAAFGVGKWEACAVDGRPEGLAVGALAVAVSYELSHGAIGAAGVLPAATHVKPLQHGRGTHWLVQRAKHYQDQHNVDVVIDGKGPAAMLIPDLRDAGVRLKVADTNDVLDACAGMFDLVQEQALTHEAKPVLDVAVGAAVKRSVGDRWAWGRKTSSADISTLEAVTLAAWWAGLKPPPPPAEPQTLNHDGMSSTADLAEIGF